MVKVVSAAGRKPGVVGTTEVKVLEVATVYTVAGVGVTVVA